MTSARPGLFLDRDGVLISDVHLLVDPSQVVLAAGAAGAVLAAQRAGLVVVVISNQTVVSRGLCGESQVERVHAHIDELLIGEGCEPLDGYYFCPHHPHADVQRYRQRCGCRKPEPGLLLQAAGEHEIDLADSFMVGDRPSDVAAGKRAGCRTVLITSGRHVEPPIVGMPSDQRVAADFSYSSLAVAMPTILEELGR